MTLPPLTLKIPSMTASIDTEDHKYDSASIDTEDHKYDSAPIDTEDLKYDSASIDTEDHKYDSASIDTEDHNGVHCFLLAGTNAGWLPGFLFLSVPRARTRVRPGNHHQNKERSLSQPPRDMAGGDSESEKKQVEQLIHYTCGELNGFRLRQGKRDSLIWPLLAPIASSAFHEQTIQG
ncbi:hypothetical protein ACOMHN_020952 [Nucella lapillus]